MSKLFGAFGVLALGLLAACGCSSNEKSGAAATTTTGGSGGRVAAGGSRTGGSTGVNPAGCPAAQPNRGDTCTQANLACNYANQTCTCEQGGPGGGLAGAGGQAGNLTFRCRTNPDAGAATGCADGAACTLGDPNCTDTNGATCRCRGGGFGTDAGTTGTYQCFGGGGGAGPANGGAANGGAAAADCVVGNQCTAGTNCTSANGTCYCAGSGTYRGGC
jgi:hypothetical protein